MFWHLKRLPHKQEEWSSDPQNPHKSCVGVASHLPAIPASESRDLKSMLASEICHIFKLWIWLKNPDSVNTVERKELDF